MEMKGPVPKGRTRIRHVLKETPCSASIEYIEGLLTNKFQGHHAGMGDFQFSSHLSEETKIWTFTISAPTEHVEHCNWCSKSSMDLVDRFWLNCEVIATEEITPY